MLTRLAFVCRAAPASDHPSLIVDLLSHITTLTVVKVVDGMRLEAGVVAVGPAQP